MAPEDFEKFDSVMRIGVPPICIDILPNIDRVDFDSVWQASWQASSEHTVDGCRARYISAGHRIQNKLAAGRPQDLADVAAFRQPQAAKTEPRK